MPELSYLQIHVNGQQIFLVNEEIITKFSGKLRKLINQEKRRTQIRNSVLELDDFPGGPDGFELVSRFCYNNGSINITVSSVSLLHSCANFLGMREKVSPCNLLQQTETFLEGMFYWSWSDLLICLKNCGSFFNYADSSGLVDKLICSLLGKIAQNSDINLHASSSSSSSSPDTEKFLPSQPCSSSSKTWWFNDLTILTPNVIEKLIKTLGEYGKDNNSLVLTKFILHYLKSASQFKGNHSNLYKTEYSGLAETAISGVIFIGKSKFSCRGLFSVLRIVGGFGLSRECRGGLEREIAGVLDAATLDDLLVCGHKAGGVYDVNLVVRLVKLFVHDEEVTVPKMKKVGRLIDKYLREIAPDQSLKVSKFLGVAESLPDFARDSFNGVYRAVDIYIESHPSLSLEERSRLCRCLNYEKLSLETSKDLAKNPKIPAQISIRALASQHTNILPPQANTELDPIIYVSPTNYMQKQMVLYKGIDAVKSCASPEKKRENEVEEEDDDVMKLGLEKMQWRVVELEKLCREMKGQMSSMVRGKVVISPTAHNRQLPRLC